MWIKHGGGLARWRGCSAKIGGLGQYVGTSFMLTGLCCHLSGLTPLALVSEV